MFPKSPDQVREDEHKAEMKRVCELANAYLLVKGPPLEMKKYVKVKRNPPTRPPGAT